LQRHVIWLAIGLMLVLGAGCRPSASDVPGAEADLTLQPDPPTVGDNQVILALTDEAGAPIENADVRLEGNMNHAGMKPSFADLQEVEPGRYAGTLDFTMGGDWFILVTAKLPDGRTLDRKIDVPGVEAK
jgi:hypothetical protein